MALTPTFSQGGDFEVADEGKYVCRISSVTGEDRPSYDDPNVLEPNYVWDFETVKDKDSKGNPYRFRYFTKTAYGNEKAKLTLLVNGALGRAFVPEQVAQMDFEKFVGKEVGVLIGMTASGKNKVLSVKALPARPIKFEDVMIDGADKRVTPPANDDDTDDPFGDE